MRSRSLVVALLATWALASPARADVLSIDVSGRCSGDAVRVTADGLPESDETETATVSACAPGDETSTAIGSIEGWDSWECECSCYLGPDEGESFACGEGSCDPTSQESCNAAATGVADVTCEDLASYDRICLGEGVHCDSEGEGCGPLTGTSGAGNGTPDGGMTASGSGDGGCSTSLHTARRGLLAGFVLTMISALVALRRRRSRA